MCSWEYNVSSALESETKNSKSKETVTSLTSMGEVMGAGNPDLVDGLGELLGDKAT